MQIRHKETGAVLADIPGDTLKNVSLRGRDLQGADLRSQKLIAVDLSEANLAGADFSGALLARVVLNAANLSGTNWTGARLCAVMMKESNLTGADMTRLRASSEFFTAASLWRYLLAWVVVQALVRHVPDPWQTVMIVATFAVIAGAMSLRWWKAKRRWREGEPDTFAVLEGSANVFNIFDHATMTGVNLEGADLSACRLHHVNLSGARLRNSVLQSAEFSGANLAGADLRDAGLRRADLPNANLAGADLRDANMEAALMSGANVNGALYDARTIWPRDFMYHRHGAVREVASVSEARRVAGQR